MSLQHRRTIRLVRTAPWGQNCPGCDQPMRLRLVIPVEPGRETRIFECRGGRTESVAVRLRHTDTGQAPASRRSGAARLRARSDEIEHIRDTADGRVSMPTPRSVASIGPAATTEAARPARTESSDRSVREAMLLMVPSLRAFAISLCRNSDRADDLVQDTLLRALANIHSFQPGTSMGAWLFTILRNRFLSEYRRQRREVQDSYGSHADSLRSPPDQHGKVELEEFRAALAELPFDQREALILVGASGFSYADAAAICRVAIGTIKSRVNRARQRLSARLAINRLDTYGPDSTTCAVLNGAGRSDRRQV